VKGLELVLSRLERRLYRTPGHCLQAARRVLASALAHAEAPEVQRRRRSSLTNAKSESASLFRCRRPTLTRVSSL
jgi:hypothetical protein